MRFYNEAVAEEKRQIESERIEAARAEENNRKAMESYSAAMQRTSDNAAKSVVGIYVVYGRHPGNVYEPAKVDGINKMYWGFYADGRVTIWSARDSESQPVGALVKRKYTISGTTVSVFGGGEEKEWVLEDDGNIQLMPMDESSPKFYLVKIHNIN